MYTSIVISINIIIIIIFIIINSFIHSTRSLFCLSHFVLFYFPVGFPSLYTTHNLLLSLMSKPQKITAQTLRTWLTEAPDTVAIVDVRDDDRIGVSTASFFFYSHSNEFELCLIHYLFINIYHTYYIFINFIIIIINIFSFLQGHIKSSINIPSTLFHSSLAALDAKVANVPRVVFHCQLSQIRGPSCASAYWRHTYNENTAGQPGQQQIYVLEGGFSEWARVYGTDSTVTDAFRPELYR